MLRRTAARAFGSGAAPPAPGSVPEGITRPGWDARSAAVDRLFDELVEAVRSAVSRLESASSAGGGEGGAAPVVSGPRAEIDGYRWTVEGPGGSVRFTNSLQGYLFARSERVGSAPTEELLTLERREGGAGWRPIRKLLLPPPARTAFRYTSLDELTRDCLDRALGRDPEARG